MDYRVALGIIATVIAVISYVGYFRDIFKGKTKPHAFSWLIWTIVTGIAFFGQLSGSAGPGAWVTGFTAIVCIGIFIASLKYGRSNIVKLDWFFLTGAGIAILLWILLKGPLLSVILATAIDCFAFIPTIRKSIHKPYEETLSLYAINTVKFFLSLLALQNFTLLTALYPASWVILNFGFVVFLILRRNKLKV